MHSSLNKIDLMSKTETKNTSQKRLQMKLKPNLIADAFTN